jgi:hypothetical protein
MIIGISYYALLIVVLPLSLVSGPAGIDKLIDFMAILLIAAPAKLLIFGPG